MFVVPRPRMLVEHARTDDFATMVGKARQYMDAQEQAKISAILKKPNVRFAATEDTILDGLQKVLQTVLDNQNRSPEANVCEKVPGNGGSKKGKGKDNRAQSPANSDISRGRPNEAPAARSQDDNQLSRWNEGRQGNQYNRSSSADSQARGPRWNSGSPPGATDSRPRGQEEDRPFQKGYRVWTTGLSLLLSSE